MQPSWAEELKILEQLRKNFLSTDLPCFQSLEPESSELISVTSDGHHLKNIEEATVKCRETLVMCKVTVLLDAKTPTR